jgi:hypothetical protein
MRGEDSARDVHNGWRLRSIGQTQPPTPMTQLPDNPEGGNAPDKLQHLADSARDKAQHALKTGEGYVRENPWPILFGALIIGASIGILLSHRERRQADLLETTRDWLDSARDTMAHKLHRGNGFLKRACHRGDDVLEQAQQVGRKLKFW